MFTSMDIDVAGQVAVALERAREELRQIEDTYLGPIGELAKDESLVEDVRKAVYDVAEIAIEVAEYIKDKIEDLQKIANSGWDVDIDDLADILRGSDAGAILARLPIPGTSVGQPPRGVPGGGIAGGGIAGGGGNTSSVTNAVSYSSTSSSLGFVGKGTVDPLEQFPRLKELVESGEVDPSEIEGILQYLQEHPEFEAEWFHQQLENAVVEHDPAKAKALAAIMWDYLESVEPAVGQAFWEEATRPSTLMPVIYPGHYMMVLVAAGGLPRVPFIVNKTFSEPLYLDAENQGNFGILMKSFGKPDPILPPSDNWELQQGWWDNLVAGELANMAGLKEIGPGINYISDPDGMDVILEAFMSPTAGGGQSYEHRNSVLFKLAETSPDKILVWAGGKDESWSQNLADQLAIDAPEGKMENLFSQLTARAAGVRQLGDDGPMTVAEDLIFTDMLKGLGQMDKAMKAVGHGSSIKLGVVGGILIGFVPGPFGKGAGVMQKVLGIIEPDPIPGQRRAETESEQRDRDLALVVLASDYERRRADDPLTNPGDADGKHAPVTEHPAKVISDYFDQEGHRTYKDRPPTEADWNRLKTAAQSDPDLAVAVAALEDTTAAIKEAYD